MVATALASIPGKDVQPAVSLILRSREKVLDYNRQGGKLTIDRVSNGMPLEYSRNIPAIDPISLKSSSSSTLDNLVVSVKVQQTIPAIQSLLPVITPKTTILLLQNGMGTYERLCDTFWPDINTRPQFFLGITTHGVNKITSKSKRPPDAHAPEIQEFNYLNTFRYTHASNGVIKVAKVPQKPMEEQISIKDDVNSPSFDQQNAEEALASPLIDCLIKAPGLQTEVLSYTAFIIAQTDKLLANAVINPLTAIFECYNGELTALSSIDLFIDQIINEFSMVFKKELEGKIPTPIISTIVDKTRLKAIALDVIEKTSGNRSSMLQDVQALSDTEIDYINGYIWALATKNQVPITFNKLLVEMVKSKVSLGRDREKRSLPLIN